MEKGHSVSLTTGHNVKSHYTKLIVFQKNIMKYKKKKKKKNGVNFFLNNKK